MKCDRKYSSECYSCQHFMVSGMDDVVIIVQWIRAFTKMSEVFHERFYKNMLTIINDIEEPSILMDRYYYLLLL